MRATLITYAAFVGISLMLWGGCFAHRNQAGATVSAPAVINTR